MEKYTAKLWLEPSYIHVDIDEIDFHLMFRVAGSMMKILRIKEQDRGYMVIDAEFENIGVVEDYLDIKDSLIYLNISYSKIIDSIEKVVLTNG